MSTRPLDGGIALKPRQTLVGAGPRVTDERHRHPLPRIENTGRQRQSGDAVELANHSTVSNLVIGPTYRGGIHGSNVAGVRVRGNVVSGTNTSCTTGFVVQPFTLPTLVAGVGVPFSNGLANGWAAIMVDESHASSRTRSLSIDDNLVRDAQCADGIDVRAMRSARVTAHVSDNVLTRLREGASQQSVLAIGMQTTGTARLDAHVNGNTETYIGSATAGDNGDADSEGLFANSAGHSRLVEHATHNRFAHGLGHLSANCVEVAASNGGPTMHFSLARSSCDHVVGDVLEAVNLSADATLTFAANHVLAAHSSFAGSGASEQAEPGDDGDCLLELASGAGSTTNVSIRNSRLTHCAADGLGVVSNVDYGRRAPVKELGFDIRNARIDHNGQSNLRVANATPVLRLVGRIERTDLSRSSGTPVLLEDLDTTHGTHARFDFGGGRLGSTGHNCIYGASRFDAETVDYTAYARHDWFGQPGGPPPGRVLATGGRFDTADPLGQPPEVC